MKMKSMRRHMCEARMRRIMDSRLNRMDQFKAFGLAYGSSIRVKSDLR